jgi:hypothetical protein
LLDCREEEGIELQVLSSKRSSETPPVGCSSRNSYIEPQHGTGTDADSINSSEYPVEDVTFKNGSSTIGKLQFSTLTCFAQSFYAGAQIMYVLEIG